MSCFVLPAAALSTAAQLKPLPAAIAAAHSAMAWPLTKQPPPMRYLPLANMRRVRSSTPLPPAAEALVADLDGAIELLDGGDHARVAVGLLLLGLGAADECHAVVTPLSWEDGTHFGGPPILGSAARAEASYAHALVHRYEAWHVGEYGTGWHNSAFWFGLVGALRSPDVAALYDACAAAARWRCAANGGEPAEAAWCAEALGNGWAPRVVNGLCAQVLQGEQPALARLATCLAEMELRTLTDHCLRRAGFAASSQPAAEEPPRQAARSRAEALTDEQRQCGLAAARGLSDAHAAAFAQHGRVVLRGLLPDAGEDVGAAALAARLLDAPACRAARAGDAAAVALLRDAGQACGAAGQGIWLGPRDALAVLVTGSAVQSVPDHRVFAACAADDCSAYWIDPLHGGRGVCPTTVLQWSKGTVHHATE